MSMHNKSYTSAYDNKPEILWAIQARGKSYNTQINKTDSFNEAIIFVAWPAKNTDMLNSDKY